jgi:NAD(P)-dependent dehydrogenase (short-subunit alcohol dehydrogenase family)
MLTEIRTFKTNVSSHFNLNSRFLPALMKAKKGGTLVTISSVLAKLGASQLSDYTASKAALVAYHTSLTAELAPYPNIKTILVTPGQMSTEMFNGLDQGPVANFFGPVIEPQELALKLVKMISEGRGGVLAEPAYARWISAMEVLPVGIQKVLRDLAGVDTAMKTFKPIQKKTD